MSRRRLRPKRSRRPRPRRRVPLLPLAHPQFNSVKTNSLLPGSTRSATISAMVVEDDPSVRRILTTWLNEADGFVCQGVFSDVESAIPEIMRCKPDVVLTDINLPGLSGIECV